MIVRTQESALEARGSSRPCSLPRSHPGHRQEYTRTHGPWIAASGSSWCRQAAGEIPRFSAVRSDGPAIHRAECCLAIFPLPWLVTAGTGAGAAARPPHSPWGRLSRPLLLGRLFPTFLHSATYLLAGFVRCRLFSERHTLQTLKPGGFNQWLPTTTQNPQRNSGSEPSRRPFGKTRSAATQSFRFVNLLSVAKLADQAHTLIAERKAEAAPAAGDNEAS